MHKAIKRRAGGISIDFTKCIYCGKNKHQIQRVSSSGNMLASSIAVILVPK